jgi:hypothetical protein
MEASCLLNGVSEAIPGHRMLDGADLEIAYDLQGDDLILPVNKGGVLVFRAMLADAAMEMGERQLTGFNSFAPDMVFRIGDSKEGLERMLGSACRSASNSCPLPARTSHNLEGDQLLDADPGHGFGAD